MTLEQVLEQAEKIVTFAPAIGLTMGTRFTMIWELSVGWETKDARFCTITSAFSTI